MKKIVEYLMFATCLLLSVSVQAHEGHAEPGTLAHDLAHAVWIAAAVFSFIYTLLMSGAVSRISGWLRGRQEEKKNSVDKRRF